MNRVRLATLPLLVVAFSPGARADSVVQISTAAPIPPGTVAVLDPAVGSSSGTPGQDVKVAVGDLLRFRFAVASLPVSAVRGIQSYVTVFLPAGLDLVGARIVDAEGGTLPPRRAGLALDGCGGGSSCNLAPPGHATGSIAQVYADTGIFYTTSIQAGTRTPEAEALTLRNGIFMSAEPARIDPEMVTVLGDTSGSYFAHSAWDWNQVQAFGSATSPVANGDGNTPYLYGSPVAGQDTFYRFEVTGGSLSGTVGPWARIAYPGSQIGSGVGNIGSTSNMTRVGVDTASGTDVSPASAVPARAVRFALGEAHAGETRYVEVAVRVTAVPLDPAFGPSGANVLCAEVFGGAPSSASANSGGDTNPWPHYVGHPQCTYLRTSLDAAVDRSLAVAGDVLTYTVAGRSLSVDAEHNARLVARFDGVEQAYLSAAPPPSNIASCPPPDAGKTCLTWALGTLLPSDTFRIGLRLQVSGGGAARTLLTAQYLSDELAALDPQGTMASAATVIQPTASPRLVLANLLDPAANAAPPGSSTWQVQGVLSNAGTASWASESLTVILPSGWLVTGGTFRVGGILASCIGGCGTSSPTFGTSFSHAPGQARSLSFQVTNNVAPGGSGLFDLDLRVRGSQVAVGSFETEFRKAVTVPVGSVRTAPPVLSCPIPAAATSVSGTGEAGAAIQVLLDGIARGSATATAGGEFTASVPPVASGAEVRATALAAGKLRSEESLPCSAGRLLPGEVTGLLLSHSGGATALSWSAASGGDPAGFRYDVLRSEDPSSFAPAGTCLVTDVAETAAADAADPGPGTCSYYLVRARGLWGTGTLGSRSSGQEREGRSCP